MKKQFLTTVFSAAILAGFAAAPLSVQAEGNGEYTIGVILTEQFDTMDDVTMGFEDAILDGLKSETILFDEISSEGDPSNYGAIIDSFLAEGDQLIFANGAEMYQAATARTREIPIIATALYNFAVSDATNTTGVSAMASYNEQASLIKDLVPDAVTIGVIHSTGDLYSDGYFSGQQAEGITEALTNLGLTCKDYLLSSDVESVIQTAAEECDAIYLPVDPEIKANAKIISSITLDKKIPVVTAEEAVCALCGLATIAPTPYELGYAAGEMAVKVIQGDDITSIDVESPYILLREYNEATAAALEISIPDGYDSIATVEFEEGDDEEIIEEEE